MKHAYSLIVVIVVMIFMSCSGTKHLPAGESLYVGTRSIKLEKVPASGWNIKQASIKKGNAYWTVWDLPNGAAFGLPSLRTIPMRLLFYNWFYTEKTKGFSYWMMNNFGEPPVTVSSVHPDMKTQKLINIFENYGHFGTTGSFNIAYNRRKTKGTIHYHLYIPKAYTYRTVTHEADSATGVIAPYLSRYHEQSLLRHGDEFDLDIIKAEKITLWTYLQNNGHFFIQHNQVAIQADTTVGNKQIDVRVSVDPTLPKVYYTTQAIAGRSIVLDTLQQNTNDDKFYRWDAGKIRRRLLDSLIVVKPLTPYSLGKVKESIRNLTETGLFNSPQITFTVASADSSTLQAGVSAKTRDATSLSVNAKTNYRATGYFGPSLGMNLTQLNLFNGAENLSIDLDGYYYFPVGVYKESISRSSGFSLRSTLSSPMIKPPFKFISRSYSLPKKNIVANAELNTRKDYFTLASFSLGYAFTWKSSDKISHRLSPIEGTYSDILNTTPLYDTLLEQNPSLQNSLIDQFILGSFYSFKYDNLSTANKRVGTYFEGKLELAGNTLSLLSRLGNSDRDSNGRRGVFGLDFSQFVEVSYEFRSHLRLSNRSQLAFRHIGGIGVAYGNSKQLPYIRQFFIGGSNSLRPINARSVGPGRYIELKEGEVNQVGDIKFEVNLEYRFKLNTWLSGALWSDAGNIWLLREDPNRPYTQIQWNKVFEDSYLTAGAGLRFDVNLLILRFDYGCVLYAPMFVDGYKWLWQNKLKMWGPVIGFGLPF